MANRITGAAIVARRRVLLDAGAAVVAMPQVSRAQTAIWRLQSARASRDIFHEFAVDYAKKVEEMTGGRLKFDVLVAGSVVPAPDAGCRACRNSRWRSRRLRHLVSQAQGRVAVRQLAAVRLGRARHARLVLFGRRAGGLQPYLVANNLGSGELAAAYKHFFGQLE